jgi:hypothetical protein
MLLALGYVALSLALVGFVWAAISSYRTAGGVIGQVPVLAAAVQPAVLLPIALSIVGRYHHWTRWPWWQYLGITIGSMIVSVVAISAFGKLGHRRRWGHKYE